MKKINSLKRKYPIKIENRGKCSSDELNFTEEMLDFICNKLDRGVFMKIAPKLFYVLKKSEIEEFELVGFECTVNSPFFKGRIEIRETCEGTYNIYFYRKSNQKGKSLYEFDKKVLNVEEEKFSSIFEFLNIDNEDIANIQIKKEDVVMLDSGYVGIIKKYSSNLEIGIVFDEDSTEIEAFITKSQIVKKIR